MTGRVQREQSSIFSDSLSRGLLKKQCTVVLSTCEAEFMAAAKAACQALWLRSLIRDLTDWKEEIVKLYVDNKYAINLM